MVSIIYFDLVSMIPLGVLLELFSALIGIIVGVLAFVIAGAIVFKIID